ncbi:OmpH family outer membrane protein [Candidatus Xenohaliotis californiensis]
MVTFATSAAPKVNISTVDLQLIMEKAQVIKDINEQVEKLETDMRKQYVTIEEKYNKDKEDLLKIKSTLSTDAYEKKLDDINQHFMKSQNDFQYQENQINKARYTSFSKVQEQIMSIVSNIAKKENVSFVIPKGITLYSDSEITEDVLNQLNATMAKSELKIEDK